MNTSTVPPSSTDVVIVGAGPVGLTLAAVLAARGVDHVVVDRLAEGANTSRAAGVHARTLEVLEELDISRTMVERGLPLPLFAARDRHRALVTVPFSSLPTAYPYTLMLPQNETEEILLDRLGKLGGAVHRPYEAVGAAQDGDGVTVTVTGGDGAEHEIRGRYAVGADGVHSTVREEAGIGFSGRPYEEHFALADVRMRWPRERDRLEMLVSPQGPVVVAPLPHEMFRVVATVAEGADAPDADDVQRILTERGAGRVAVQEVLWSSDFHIQHRLADRYRAGRLFLAGDAAHVHSPAGGQGMNIGVQDAVALGHALHTALTRAERAEEVLDGYGRARRPVARRVIAFTDFLTRTATVRRPAARLGRNTAMLVAGRIPAFRRAMAARLAELR
ncbi:NAD(P)/FAD-dependent oxidoreductase [Streptomyces capparidis]